MPEFLIQLEQKSAIFKDLIAFMWEQKLWWLLPMVVMMALIGFVLVAAKGSVIAPFIYTLF